MVKKAMVLNNDGHWIYGDCTRNDELDGGEFWKLDGNQVIEPRVGDHLKGLINPVSEGCQAGDPPLTVEQHQEILDDLAENDKPVRIGSPVEPYEWTEKHDEQLKSAMVRVEQLNKPVFTQEVELLIGGGKNVPEVYKAGRFVYHGSKYSIFVTGDGKEYSRKNSKIKTRPIDNRTEKQKLMASLWDCIEQNDGDLNESSIDAFRYDLLSKFTITLN